MSPSRDRIELENKLVFLSTEITRLQLLIDEKNRQIEEAQSSVVGLKNSQALVKELTETLRKVTDDFERYKSENELRISELVEENHRWQTAANSSGIKDFLFKNI